LSAKEVKDMILSEETEKRLLIAQRNELTEHIIYERLAQSTKDAHNKNVLRSIARDELKHHDFWRQYTNSNVQPDRLAIWKYYIISRVFGTTFGMKLMERGEDRAEEAYKQISESMLVAKDIMRDEEEHEKELINLIDEERLRYVGSMVLGLNDALVELTGALAGLTFALQNTRLIAMAGSITGIAASLSMASSEYLSTKSESEGKNPAKASIYTGVAYILTVLFLIFPYLLLSGLYYCLGCTILNAIVAISVFTFYISVAKDIPFTKRFSEMAAISLGVTALSFGVGFLIRVLFDVEI
jgi:VIT1/CCC1 family predicted Fe2+/Mn2+ transporter